MPVFSIRGTFSIRRKGLKAWLNHQTRVQFRPSCARVTLPRAAEVGVPGVAPDDEMKERAMMVGNLALFHVANMMTMEEFSYNPD